MTTETYSEALQVIDEQIDILAAMTPGAGSDRRFRALYWLQELIFDNAAPMRAKLRRQAILEAWDEGLKPKATGTTGAASHLTISCSG